MEKEKIILIVSHCPDALISKRISLLKNKYQVFVLYNERGNKNFNFIKGVKYVKLHCKFENGKLISRIAKLIKLRNEIQTMIKEIKPQVLYAFRLDMLWLTINKMTKKKKIIYEVADLHEIVINNSKNKIKLIAKKLIKFIEKKLCRYIDILSITSEKFYDVYFKEFVEKNKVVYMPNIPDLKYFEKYKKIRKDKFTIGFIGVVRYKEQMKMLMEATKDSDVKVLFAGSSQDNEIEKIAKRNSWVEYYGKYNYSKDIAKLYSKCDCIYSVYDTKYNNVKYALPNKLYESIYCELPIIVSKNTYLSEIVQKLGVGCSVEDKNVTELKKIIDKLKNNKDYYDEIVINCKKNKKKIKLETYNYYFLEKINLIENKKG